MRCGNDPMSDVLPSLDNFHVENHKSKSFWRWPRTKDVCFPYGSDLRVFSFYLQSFLADIVFPVWPTVVFCRISLWDHHLIHQHCLEGVRSPTSCPGKRVNGQSQSPDLCYKIAVYHIGKHNCCYVIIGRFIYPAVYIYIYICVYRRTGPTTLLRCIPTNITTNRAKYFDLLRAIRFKVHCIL